LFALDETATEDRSVREISGIVHLICVYSGGINVWRNNKIRR
jgi:hypothetical protein